MSGKTPGPPEMKGFLRSYYELRPVNATFTGVHTYDDQLPNWSPDGLEQTLRSMTDVHRGLQPPGTGSTSADADLACAFLEIQAAEIESYHFHRANPSLHLGEAIFGVLSLMLREFASPEQRAENVLARLRGWPMLLDNASHSVNAPKISVLWLKRTMRELLGANVLLEHGIGMWAKQEGLPEALQRDLLDAAKTAGASLDVFTVWLRGRRGTESAPACGTDLFDLLLARGHHIATPRSDLLDEAKVSLLTAKNDLQQLLDRVEPRGIDIVHERLASEHPTSSKYLETFHDQWSACRALADAKALCTWPDFPIRYRHIPKWARKAAPFLYFLFYRSPPPFDDLPFAEYLVPVAHDAESLRAVNLSVIKQNHVAHHGGLGHHVQNYYAYRSDTIVGQIAAVDCASRIGMFCGGTMAEGWACYATDLMEEVGFLTECESISLQENRVKQIVRAIADIELHQGSMAIDDVERLFVEHTGVSRRVARNEVTKVSMFPGTGLMYWYGTKRIHEMRAGYERANGELVSLCDFHDQVLSHGSLPVDVIADRMAGEKVA